MTETTKTYRWRRLHVFDARDLWRRWKTNSDVNVEDDLLSSRITGQDNSQSFIWTVRTTNELVRLIGALQHFNPGLTLWFRGEDDAFPHARPSRCRGYDDHLEEVLSWLDNAAAFERVLRDRGRIARLAILQHYGVATSFLDVSHSLHVACQFAHRRGGRPSANPHLRVFATPRAAQAQNVYADSDLCVVDLRAELPSYCLRPHVQEAGFIGKLDAILTDLDGKAATDDASLDDICVARIKLELVDWDLRFKYDHSFLFPEPARSCKLCPDSPRPDLNRDFLPHVLSCVQKRIALPASIQHFPFPNCAAQPPPRPQSSTQ